MYQLAYNIGNVIIDGGAYILIVALGSVVLRRERAHRRDEAAMRRTHDAIMQEVNGGD